MRKFGFALTMLSALTCGLGCSQSTVDKADEAATAAGEAAESAMQDAAENVGNAAGEVEESMEGEATVEETPAE